MIQDHRLHESRTALISLRIPKSVRFHKNRPELLCCGIIVRWLAAVDARPASAPRRTYEWRACAAMGAVMCRPADAADAAAVQAACRGARADAIMAAVNDRWFAETLTQVDGQPAAKSAVMFTRIAILLEVVADRRR